jgi:hypothetical protein
LKKLPKISKKRSLKPFSAAVLIIPLKEWLIKLKKIGFSAVKARII